MHVSIINNITLKFLPVQEILHIIAAMMPLRPRGTSAFPPVLRFVWQTLFTFISFCDKIFHMQSIRHRFQADRGMHFSAVGKQPTAV